MQAGYRNEPRLALDTFSKDATREANVDPSYRYQVFASRAGS